MAGSAPITGGSSSGNGGAAGTISAAGTSAAGVASGGSSGSGSGGAGAAAGSGGAAGSAAAGSSGAGGQAGSPSPALDVTFFVVADVHADPVLQDDLLAQARAITAVAANGSWPVQLEGQATGFAGGAIGSPRAVVFVGDLTGWGTAPTEIPTVKHYFEAGNSQDSIGFPAYLGLGNHDVDSADRGEPLASQYRQLVWGWVDARHGGAGAPAPVTRFDAGSHAYSFDLDGAHLVQLHRFAGDVQYGLPSAVPFLQQDLELSAKDGRPVVLFHHYGMDTFGTEDRWWTLPQRDAYRSVLGDYHVSAIFVGHSHAAFNYTWAGLRVFQVNNSKAENGTGNNDGNGSFAIARLTNERLDVVTCRWLDTAGHYELIPPYFSGPR
jgi:cytolysin (calcineurin-like family phosphatase)